MSQKMNRNDQIDVLRAWGIFLVVAGHNGSPYYDYIYTFHMPLFFFVSGFLRYSSGKKTWLRFLKDKVKGSLLPYVLFWGFSMLIYGQLYSLLTSHKLLLIDTNSVKGLILGGRWLANYSNNFPLWYLQLHFLAIVFFELIVRFSKNSAVVIWGGVLILLTIPIQVLLPGRPVFHINVFPTAVAFMSIGFLFHVFIEKHSEIMDLLNKGAFGTFLLIFGWCISSRNKGNACAIHSYWYYVGAVLTIVAMFSLSYMFTSCKAFQYIGRNTLGILGLHSLMLHWSKEFTQFILEGIGSENGFFVHIFSTVITIILCCGLIELWKYTKEMFKHFHIRNKWM